jgi:hypothetical protein
VRFRLSGKKSAVGRFSLSRTVVRGFLKIPIVKKNFCPRNPPLIRPARAQASPVLGGYMKRKKFRGQVAGQYYSGFDRRRPLQLESRTTIAYCSGVDRLPPGLSLFRGTLASATTVSPPSGRGTHRLLGASETSAVVPYQHLRALRGAGCSLRFVLRRGHYTACSSPASPALRRRATGMPRRRYGFTPSAAGWALWVTGRLLDLPTSDWRNPPAGDAEQPNLQVAVSTWGA